MSEESADTGSGVYRKLAVRALPIVSAVLWLIVTGLCAIVWNDVREVTKDVVTLKAQRVEDKERYDSLSADLKAAVKDIQQDIKEILREIRK